MLTVIDKNINTKNDKMNNINTKNDKNILAIILAEDLQTINRVNKAPMLCKNIIIIANRL